MERVRHGIRPNMKFSKKCATSMFICWDQCNELDVPWKLSLKMRPSKKTTSMIFFLGGAGGLVKWTGLVM